MSLSVALLPELDLELALLRKCLERLPGDQFGYQPHPRSMTLGQLALHLAQMPVWGATTIRTPELDLSKPFERPKAETTAELLAIFDEAAKGYREALEGASDDDLMATWRLLGPGGTVFVAMPRMAVLRGMVMNHLVHHRGQLSVYMRMLEIPVPSIYGPSADEGNR